MKKSYVVGVREVHVRHYSVQAENNEEAKDMVYQMDGSVVDLDFNEFSHQLDRDTWSVEERSKKEVSSEGDPGGRAGMRMRDTMLDIARKIILHRASLDGYTPDEYDPVKDDEGYVVSLLIALRHWCDVHSIDWQSELDRAERLFAEDMAESETTP